MSNRKYDSKELNSRHPRIISPTFENKFFINTYSPNTYSPSTYSPNTYSPKTQSPKTHSPNTHSPRCSRSLVEWFEYKNNFCNNQLTTCSINISEDIDLYLKYGWKTLSHLFTGNKVGKLKILRHREKQSSEDEFLKRNIQNALELITAVRKYIIHDVFTCITVKQNDSNKCIYESFGSSDILSDYDINILGSNAPDVVFEIFKLFLLKYNSTLPYAVDTNIYCNGYYLSPSSFPKYLQCESIHTVKYNSNDIIYFQPCNVKTKKKCIQYAFLKLYQLLEHTHYISDVHTQLVNTIKNFFTRNINSEFSSRIRNVYDTLQRDLNEFSNPEYTELISKLEYSPNFEETNDYVKRYMLMHKYSTQLFDMLYSERDTYTDDFDENIFIDTMCKANYYAIEAYYTPCTINVVVLEKQAGLNIRLDNINYICSIIENLGDLLHHYFKFYSNEVSHEELLYFFQKYMYRIALSLSKIHTLDSENTEEELRDYKKNPKLVYTQQYTGQIPYIVYYTKIILNKIIRALDIINL